MTEKVDQRAKDKNEQLVNKARPARFQPGYEPCSHIAHAADSDHFHAFPLLSLVIDRLLWRLNAASTVLPGVVRREGFCLGQAWRVN
jgi:hypothetical protein